MYERKKREGNLLVVSSTAPQEGKTTLAVNLALALAQDEKKVLLIEGDLRKPGLAAYLELADEKIRDWGDCAMSASLLNEAVYPVEKAGFSVLVNNKKQARSTEIVGSRPVRNFLEHMKKRVDVIIVDAPHVKGRSDAEMWAAEADMTVLVVKQNKVLAKYINDAVDVLDHQDNKLLGCIFIFFPEAR